VLLAREEIRWEKRALSLVRLRLGPEWYAEPFLRSNHDWQVRFSDSEVEFVVSLTEKYRTTDPEELARRIDILPVSLTLAQGALESSWGTSRFALEGNSVFGVWTWGSNGIVPERRDVDKTHRVAHYNSLLDSVRAYLLNLNRMEFYEKLRQLRQNSDDSIVLSSGLLYYSIRRHDYVKDVRLVIDHKDLKEYDMLYIK
jgi:Bax protein